MVKITIKKVEFLKKLYLIFTSKIECMIKKYLLFIGLLTLTGTVMWSQHDEDQENKGRFRYFEFRGHSGNHLYTGNTLSEYLKNGYGSVELRYGWQPNKPEGWAIPYGSPSYGIGAYVGYIGDIEVFGNPNALFGFINFPLSKPHKRNVFAISPSLGLTYNLKHYDPVDNPDNDAIGASMAVYFNLNLGGEYKFTRETDLLYGIDFTHFSNGRTVTPNFGLNMFGINLGLRYMYNRDQKLQNKDFYANEDILRSRYKRPVDRTKTKFDKPNSIDFYVAVGTVQNSEDQGTDKRYYTFSGVIDYRYRFNNMHGVTTGFDVFYDGSLVTEYPETSDQFMYAVHAGYDFSFYKFVLRLQAGTYFGDDKGKKSLFLRPAIHYEFNDFIFAQIGLKTQKGGRADWVEWGIGIRPFKW